MIIIMLESQKEFATYLKKMQGLLNDQEFSFDQTLLPKVMETELVVPIVGAFSAGKSSLLNALMDNEILPVGIAPETELATELRYSPESYLLAIKPDGEQERLPIEALSSINRRSSEFSHLRLYLNNEALKAIAPLVLVDMPGFGSSLENHNKAIAYYLPRGVHFVVLTSIEDGNITQSMLRKLDELKTYNTDFTFLLSKCNLRAADQVEEVQSYIDDQLEVYFGEHCRSITLGKRGGKELTRALIALQPDTLFSRLFIDILKDQSFEVLAQINLALSMLKKDKAESEQAAHALEQALVKLLEQRKGVESDLKERYSGKMLDRSLRGLDNALNESLEELVTVGSGKNPSALSNALSDIIRSSLANTIKSEVQDISTSMIDRIASNLSATSSQMSTLDISSNWSEELSSKVKLSLERTTEILSDWSTRLNNRAENDKNDGVMLYRSLSTVLAVTTTVVNPLVELVIIFLPEIIKMLNGGGNEREKLRQKLTSEVFPNIKAELRGKIPAIIDEQLNAMLKKISDGFEEQITKQKYVIDTIAQENQQREAQIGEKTAALESLANAIKAAANEHLYK
ncbi:dynamin family protein [Azotobacter chroococcum]|uniref:p-loop containing nucleoside triphosphate hydrolase n=1 Tax=Azotobacter chroococcum NCIMB 8003 TaxID=1328314 RepID=A0A0C4WPN0_9GAMM|nr:dynamin family protein [Azotobacter chroococcum]AJE20117.1 P-loop containing nucleoside triphosphate hydrolase [Azotobacter chroococcum NCIMB 8003]